MNNENEKLSEYKKLTAEIRKYNEAYEAGEAIVSALQKSSRQQELTARIRNISITTEIFIISWIRRHTIRS